MTTCVPIIAVLRPSPVTLSTCPGQSGDDLMAALAKKGYDFRADQAGAADGDDLHGLSSVNVERAAP
jgi:hypothetical protein